MAEDSCLGRKNHCPIAEAIIDTVSYKAKPYNVFQFEIIHEQLPLPVPCYDLLPVIELTVGRVNTDFGYSQLP
jgi:hypothetical protein